MEYLTLDAALKIPGRKTMDLEVKELGGTLRLAEPSAAKSFEFRSMESRKRVTGEDLERKQMELLLRAGVITAEGSMFFKDDSEVRKFIEVVSVTTMQTIIKKILELMIPDERRAALEKAKDAEATAVEKPAELGAGGNA